MKINYLLAAMVAGSFFTTYLYGQQSPQTLSDSTKKSVEMQKNDKMQTLFSGVKNPIKKPKYVGLSLSPELQLGVLAGQFTPMAGVSGMLHLNKKWGMGLAAYSTSDNRFAPTALSANKTLSLGAMYGGLKLEFTPQPNAKVHLSFPLIIGGGMSRVDSVGSRFNKKYEFGDHRGKGRGDFGGNTSFFVIQPGVNLEANVFRYVKIFAGVSYRIVPTVDVNNRVTTAFPTPTSSQLSGINLSAGVRAGLFDYPIRRTNRQRKLRRTPRNRQ